MAEPAQQVKTPAVTQPQEAAAKPESTAGTRGPTMRSAAASADGYDAQAALLVPPPPNGGKSPGKKGPNAEGQETDGQARPTTLDPKERAAVELQVRAEIRDSVASAWMLGLAEVQKSLPAVLQAQFQQMTAGLDPKLVVTNTRQLAGAADLLTALDPKMFEPSPLENTTLTTADTLRRTAAVSAVKHRGGKLGHQTRLILNRLEDGTFTAQDIRDLIAVRAEIESAYRELDTIRQNDQAGLEWVVEQLTTVVSFSKAFFDLTENVPGLKLASLGIKGAMDVAGAISESANGMVSESISENVAKATANFFIDTAVSLVFGKLEDRFKESSLAGGVSDRVKNFAVGNVRKAATAATKVVVNAMKAQVTALASDWLKGFATKTEMPGLEARGAAARMDLVKEALSEAGLVDLFKNAFTSGK